MRSYNHLWENMIDRINVERCFKSAAKNKTSRHDVRRALESIDTYVPSLINRLNAGTWKPRPHKPCMRSEGSNGKVRKIIKPGYEEQVVHHMLVSQLQPIILRGMYRHCCGSVPGRGTHSAKRTMEKWRDSYKGHNFYVAELDIHKFYDSIDLSLLKSLLAKTIRDKRFLSLLYIVIDSGAPSENKGLPLGFYTSQWLANFFLQRFDYYILQTLKPNHYLRYMDNLYLFHKNKKELHRMVREIERYLRDNLGLSINRNWQVYRFERNVKGRVCGRAINALGFVLHRNRTTIRKSILRRIRRKANHIKKKAAATRRDACALISYLGYFDHASAYAYFKKYVASSVNIRAMKQIIRRHARKERKYVA